MGAKITRRDFLNGVALTAGAAIIPPEMWAAAAAICKAIVKCSRRWGIILR